MNNDSPWWIKFFVQVGFPSAIAVVLIAALLGWMPSPIMQALSRLESNSYTQTMLMRSICYAQVVDKRSCEPWRSEN